MNKNSRSYKILSQVKSKSKNEDAVLMPSVKKLTIRTDVNKQFRKAEPNVLSDITSLSSNSESLSAALGTLKEECIQARKILNVSEENLDENIHLSFSGNEDFVTEVIALDNTDKLDALIDLNTLNSVDITVGEESYKDNNHRQDDILNHDQEELEENKTFEYNIDMNAVEEDSPLVNEDQIERESSSEEEEHFSDNENKKRKRKKNRLSDSSNWNYNINKKKRQEGASYMGRKQNKFVVHKNERKLKIKCSCFEGTGSKKSAFK